MENTRWFYTLCWQWKLNVKKSLDKRHVIECQLRSSVFYRLFYTSLYLYITALQYDLKKTPHWLVRSTWKRKIYVSCTAQCSNKTPDMPQYRKQ